MFYRSAPKSYIMIPQRRQLCRPLARGGRHAFARKCLKDRCIRNIIVKGMGVSLRHEIARLCSDDIASILQSNDRSTLKEFTWEKLLTELEEVDHTLLKLLQSCTKIRKLRKNHNAIIGVLVAIMCKHRRPKSSLFQQIVSLILYSGHAAKRV